MSRVEVVPYESTWKRDYEILRHRIWPAVENFSLRIEHVGSTSVVGLAAKPIIDIDVVVKDQDCSALAGGALTGIGYRALGNMGLEGREAFGHGEGVPRHNLYVCIEGSEPLTNHLLVRDALSRSPQLVKEYSQLKLSLAKKFPDDMETYIDGKTDFLLAILTESGFPKEALLRAERVNRKTLRRL